jgi:hypothetical protein
VLPRPYADWIAYDQGLLHLYDCCLRLTAKSERLGYSQTDSDGADAEVNAFLAMGRPIFYSIDELFAWLESKSASQPL